MPHLVIGEYWKLLRSRSPTCLAPPSAPRRWPMTAPPAEVLHCQSLRRSAFREFLFGLEGGQAIPPSTLPAPSQAIRQGPLRPHPRPSFHADSTVRPLIKRTCGEKPQLKGHAASPKSRCAISLQGCLRRRAFTTCIHASPSMRYALDGCPTLDPELRGTITLLKRLSSRHQPFDKITTAEGICPHTTYMHSFLCHTFRHFS